MCDVRAALQAVRLTRMISYIVREVPMGNRRTSLTIIVLIYPHKFQSSDTDSYRLSIRA